MTWVIRHRLAAIGLTAVVTLLLAAQIRHLQVIIDPHALSPARHPYVIATNQTLEAETTLILSFTRLDYAVRPKLMYALTDRWRLTVGADVFRGGQPSLFGRLRPNTGAYAEVRWSF